MDARVRLEHVVLAVDGEHDVHAKVEIVAPDRTRRGARAAARARHRPFGPDGRPQARGREALRVVARRTARPRDELALVSYDDEVRLLAPLAAPADHHRAAIAGIHPGGQTNLSRGWLKGLEALGRSAETGVRKAEYTPMHRQHLHYQSWQSRQGRSRPRKESP